MEALAMGGCDTIRNVLSDQRTATACNMVAGRDKTFAEALAKPSRQSTECAPAVGAEHPLFILYTSGSTGKPKGVQHSTGGYLLWAKMTMDWTFDLRADDIFWCTADIGWITGHTYGLRPAGGRRHADHLRRHPHLPERRPLLADDRAPQVHHFLHRSHGHPLAHQGSQADEAVHPARFRSVEPAHLGSVGEPINPEAWMWYHKNVGGERCPIVDTFWQTETGGHVITPCPALTAGARQLHAALPGITAAIVDEMGNDVPNGSGGILVKSALASSMIRTIWNDPSVSRRATSPKNSRATTWRATARAQR